MCNSSENFRIDEIKMSLDNSHAFPPWFYKTMTLQIILVFFPPKCCEIRTVLLHTPGEYTRSVFFYSVSIAKKRHERCASSFNLYDQGLIICLSGMVESFSVSKKFGLSYWCLIFNVPGCWKFLTGGLKMGHSVNKGKAELGAPQVPYTFKLE